MSKKPLGKDKFGVQKVMRVKDYYGTVRIECDVHTGRTAYILLYG